MLDGNFPSKNTVSLLSTKVVLKRKIMKYLAFLLLFTVIAQNAFSANHNASGKIAMMRSHAAYWDSKAWIQIEGLNGIAGCEQANHGKGSLTYIVIPAGENQLYSMLLASFMASKTVEVNFSTELTSGLCTIRFATLSQ